MSFLVPVVLGGGPTILRGTQARMDHGNAFPAVLINVGLVICVLPVPAQVRLLVGILVLSAFAAFVQLLISVSRGRHTSQSAVALALVLLAMAAGYTLAH